MQHELSEQRIKVYASIQNKQEVLQVENRNFSAFLLKVICTCKTSESYGIHEVSRKKLIAAEEQPYDQECWSV